MPTSANQRTTPNICQTYGAAQNVKSCFVGMKAVTIITSVTIATLSILKHAPCATLKSPPLSKTTKTKFAAIVVVKILKNNFFYMNTTPITQTFLVKVTSVNPRELLRSTLPEHNIEVSPLPTAKHTIIDKDFLTAHHFEDFRDFAITFGNWAYCTDFTYQEKTYTTSFETLLKAFLKDLPTMR